MRRRRALLQGLRVLLNPRNKGVPRAPRGGREVCAITGYKLGSPSGLGSAFLAREEALSAVTSPVSVVGFNDRQKTCWPVIGLYLKALVRA